MYNLCRLCIAFLKLFILSALVTVILLSIVQVTGAKHCKQQHEVKYLAETYLCLLESNAKQAELSAIYTRNERTTEQAANLVGLRLPKEKS